MIRLFESTTIPALQQTAIFTERRHELLASNLANLDTPDYRARDLSVDRFQAALSDAIEQSKHPSPGSSLSSTALGSRQSDGPRGLQAATRDQLMHGPRSAMEPVVMHDGSDVSLERNVTEIAKNQGMHNLAIATMRNQFALLRAAITERA